MKEKICSVKARQIIDSRGMPTVEATVALCSGAKGTASVPSGASTGKFEAVELRDNSKQFFGKSVTSAVENVNSVISEVLMGCDCDVYRADHIMVKKDGTKNKGKLGANATLAVSLALAKANACQRDLPLYRYLGGIYARKMPIPLMNILNGGAHASNNIDIQEFMIAPIGFKTFADALRAGCEIYNELKKLLKSKKMSVSVGDEGGFAPNLHDEYEAIELIIESIVRAGYNTEQVKISLDIASSEWWVGKGKYALPKASKEYSTDELISKWVDLVEKYPILSIEDPLGEEDYEGWARLTEILSDKVLLVGDDLFVTNKERLQMGITNHLGNAILIKPNQIGTLSETLDVIYEAKTNGYKTIISHRSGETDDTTIADIAVGANAGFIKTGAPCRMDRVVKYNRLLEIESEIYGV